MAVFTTVAHQPDLDPTMSDNYTICCIIEGEDSPFIVEIGSNAIVGHLKKAIKKEQFHTLSNIEDKHIKVYQVDLPEKPNIKEGVSKKMLENPTPLMLTTEMGEAYPSGPPKKTIHIVVRVPSSRWSCRLPPSTAIADQNTLNRSPD